MWQQIKVHTNKSQKGGWETLLYTGRRHLHTSLSIIHSLTQQLLSTYEYARYCAKQESGQDENILPHPQEAQSPTGKMAHKQVIIMKCSNWVLVIYRGTSLSITVFLAGEAGDKKWREEAFKGYKCLEQETCFLPTSFPLENGPCAPLCGGVTTGSCSPTIYPLVSVGFRDGHMPSQASDINHGIFFWRILLLL